MKVKITKAMAKALNTALKARKKAGTCTNIYNFDFTEMPIDIYARCVDWDLMDNSGDWNSNTNKFKVIQIEYNENCYSVDRFITTNDLVKCFRASDKTYNGFVDAVFNAFEI